jgi:hypothetical protein
MLYAARNFTYTLHQHLPSTPTTLATKKQARALDFMVSRSNSSATQIAHQINSLHSLPILTLSISKRLVNTEPLNILSLTKPIYKTSVHPSTSISVFARGNTGREAVTDLTGMHLLPSTSGFNIHYFFAGGDNTHLLWYLPGIEQYFCTQTLFHLCQKHQGCNTRTSHTYNNIPSASEKPHTFSPPHLLLSS